MTQALLVASLAPASAWAMPIATGANFSHNIVVDGFTCRISWQAQQHPAPSVSASQAGVTLLATAEDGAEEVLDESLSDVLPEYQISVGRNVSLSGGAGGGAGSGSGGSPGSSGSGTPGTTSHHGNDDDEPLTDGNSDDSLDRSGETDDQRIYDETDQNTDTTSTAPETNNPSAPSPTDTTSSTSNSEPGDDNPDSTEGPNTEGRGDDGGNIIEIDLPPTTYVPPTTTPTQNTPPLDLPPTTPVPEPSSLVLLLVGLALLRGMTQL